VLNLLEGSQRAVLEGEMRACFLQLKRISYGKQVIAIEKLLYGGAPPMATANMAHNHNNLTQPNTGTMVPHIPNNNLIKR
jgi:hypothetical protein